MRERYSFKEGVLIVYLGEFPMSSNLQCDPNSVSEGDMKYFRNAPSFATKKTAQTLEENQRKCIAQSLSDEGLEDEEIESRGLPNPSETFGTEETASEEIETEEMDAED